MVRLNLDTGRGYDFDDEDEDEVRRLNTRTRRRRKRKKSFKTRLKFSCCLFVLVIFVFIFIISLAAVAKTGIVEVPVFSKIFYQFPKPSRTIEVTQEDIDSFAIGLQTKAIEQSTTLEISEKELTFLLEQLLVNGSDPYFGQNLQAIVSAQEVEIFGLLLKPIKTNLTLKIKPYLADDQVNLEIKEIKAGTLAIPVSLLNWLGKNFLNDKLAELNAKINQFGEIESLECLPGKIVITGQLNLGQ